MTVTPCPYPHWRPVFGSSYNEFVFPGCWHFDNGATSKIDDIHIELGGLPHVLPLNVHLFYGGQVEGTILARVYVVAYSILVSALGPLGLYWDLVGVGAMEFGD